MIYLAHNFKEEKRYCSLRQISTSLNIPLNYLEKILLRLEKNNLIKSKKGAYGGYRLNSLSADITVGEIINSLESSKNIVGCLDYSVCPQVDQCKAVHVWRKIQKSLNQTLNSITLNSLIKNEK